MKEFIINGDIYTQVADFIRSKDGSTDTINPKKFINKFWDISTIPTDDSIDNLISGNVTEISTTATTIKNHIFCYSENLVNIDMPNVVSIGESAFEHCNNLELTALPEGITEIGRYAFQHCTKLALTSLPSTLTSIGDSAFNNCTSLTTITFKGTPTTISSSAFENCTNLTTINVPWAEGEVANAPWGADNATINYNYTSE